MREATNLLSVKKRPHRAIIFSSIFVIYWKLSSIIVRMSDNESLISSEPPLKGDYFFVNFRHLLEIIVNNCPDERQRISYLFRTALKGLKCFRHFLEIIVN